MFLEEQSSYAGTNDELINFFLGRYAFDTASLLPVIDLDPGKFCSEFRLPSEPHGARRRNSSEIFGEGRFFADREERFGSHSANSPCSSRIRNSFPLHFQAKSKRDGPEATTAELRRFQTMDPHGWGSEVLSGAREKSKRGHRSQSASPCRRRENDLSENDGAEYDTKDNRSYTHDWVQLQNPIHYISRNSMRSNCGADESPALPPAGSTKIRRSRRSRNEKPSSPIIYAATMPLIDIPEAAIKPVFHNRGSSVQEPENAVREEHETVQIAQSTSDSNPEDSLPFWPVCITDSRGTVTLNDAEKNFPPQYSFLPPSRAVSPDFPFPDPLVAHTPPPLSNEPPHASAVAGFDEEEAEKTVSPWKLSGIRGSQLAEVHDSSKITKPPGKYWTEESGLDDAESVSFGATMPVWATMSDPVPTKAINYNARNDRTLTNLMPIVQYEVNPFAIRSSATWQFGPEMPHGSTIKSSPECIHLSKVPPTQAAVASSTHSHWTDGLIPQQHIPEQSTRTPGIGKCSTEKSGNPSNRHTSSLQPACLLYRSSCSPSPAHYTSNAFRSGSCNPQRQEAPPGPSAADQLHNTLSGTLFPLASHLNRKYELLPPFADLPPEFLDPTGESMGHGQYSKKSIYRSHRPPIPRNGQPGAPASSSTLGWAQSPKSQLPAPSADIHGSPLWPPAPRFEGLTKGHEFVLATGGSLRHSAEPRGELAPGTRHSSSGLLQEESSRVSNAVNREIDTEDKQEWPRSDDGPNEQNISNRIPQWIEALPALSGLRRSYRGARLIDDNGGGGRTAIISFPRSRTGSQPLPPSKNGKDEREAEGLRSVTLREGPNNILQTPQMSRQQTDNSNSPNGSRSRLNSSDKTRNTDQAAITETFEAHPYAGRERRSRVNLNYSYNPSILDPEKQNWVRSQTAFCQVKDRRKLEAGAIPPAKILATVESLQFTGPGSLQQQPQSRAVEKQPTSSSQYYALDWSSSAVPVTPLNGQQPVNYIPHTSDCLPPRYMGSTKKPIDFSSKLKPDSSKRTGSPDYRPKRYQDRSMSVCSNYSAAPIAKQPLPIASGSHDGTATAAAIEKIDLPTSSSDILARGLSKQRPRSYISAAVTLKGHRISASSSSSSSGYPNQDRFLRVELGHKLLLLGIFDGHGECGHHVAEFVCQGFRAAAVERFGTPQDPPSPPVDTSRKGIIKWIRHTFHKVDKRLIRRHPFTIKLSHSGSTASVALVTESALHVAHVGDSRVLVSRVSFNSGTNNHVTVDHHPAVPAERTRIQAAGGIVTEMYFRQINKVVSRISNVGLSVSRAFGDLEARNYGLICEPEIMTFSLTLPQVHYTFIFIGSDGVWDTVSADEVLAAACKRLHKTSISEADAALSVALLVSSATPNLYVPKSLHHTAAKKKCGSVFICPKFLQLNASVSETATLAWQRRLQQEGRSDDTTLLGLHIE